MQRLILTLLVTCLLLTLSGDIRATQTTLAVTQVWQYKDTKMCCVPAGKCNSHPWKHATQTGCVHCSMYCGPASCAMYAIYMSRPAPFINQDDIYDNGKLSGGEILGNGTLETHGLGMFAGIGTTPSEIQSAFTFATGMPPFQHGPQGSSNPLITCDIVSWYIHDNQLILWIDIATWPADQDTIPDELLYDSGHCKIIAGYDDMDTPADCTDDSYLIYDPWPTSGSPYWLTGIQVLDPNDIYLTASQPLAAFKDSWSSIKNKFE